MPQPAPAPAQQPAVQAEPPLELPPGAYPVRLDAQERQALARATAATAGGFHTAFARWHRGVDPVTSVLVLAPDDLERVWRWGSRPRGKAVAQGYARKVFWRTLGTLFGALGKIPETTPVVARPNPRRRRSRKDQPHV